MRPSRAAFEKREKAEAKEASLARYRRRLHRIPGETDEERAWQEQCWKLPQHGGYAPGFVEAEGMVWDEETSAFRPKTK